MKRLFLATISVVLLLTGCYKDDIWQMHKEIESLRDVKLASLAEQAERMKVSIADLDGMESSLQELIAALAGSEASAENDIAAIREKITAFENSSMTGIDAAAAEFLASIKDLDAAVQVEAGAIAALAAALEEDGNAISAGIEALKAYIDDNFAKRDRFEGTFGTMEIQNAIIEDIENIKYHIKMLTASADELDQMLKDMITGSIADFRESFSGKIQEEAGAILDAFGAALSDMEASLAESGAEAVQDAVEECETSVMAWLNSRLDDYYKVVDAEAQIEACGLLLGDVPEGKTLQGEIDLATSDLESVKEAVNGIYAQAIEDAVKEHGGKISEEIDGQITYLRQEVIAPVTSRVEPLKSRFDELWQSLGKLEDSIKSAEEQREAISASIAILDELDTTLKDYVESVKSKLSGTDEANYNTLKGLIDALDAIINGDDEDSLPSRIAALRAYVGSIPDGSDATDVATWISTTLSTLEEQFLAVSKITEIDDIIDVLKDSLDRQDTRIGQLEKDLEGLIASGEATIKGWVDTKAKATGYYTAGEIEGLLEAFEKEITSYFKDGDEELQKRIDEVSDELDKQKTALVAAYTKAIEDAIGREKGTVTGAIAEQFSTSNNLLEGLISKSSSLKGEVDGLRQELDGYLNDVDAIESALSTLKAFLSAEGYSSLLAIVDKIGKDLDGVSKKYATKEDLKTVSEYVNGPLKTDVEKIADLVKRLGKVNGTLETVGAFLTGFDSADGTLKQQVTAIQSSVSALKEAVDGTDTVPGLQEQIEAILVALYGESMDEDDPSEDSIMGMLKHAAAVLAAEQLSSITYVPSYLDQKEALSANAEGTYFAQFKFMLKPAGIADLVDTNPEFFTMMFMSYEDGRMYAFERQEISVDSDGSLTVVVSESVHTDVLESGACAALFYENYDDEGVVVSSFTSKFIPLIVATTSGTGRIPASNTNLIFPATGGSITITVGDAETGKFWLVHDQNVDDTLIPAWYKITELFFRSLFPASWIHVSPDEPYGPDITMPWRKYYSGETEITISVDPNTSTKPRDGKLVFRIITLDISLEKDLVINIHQEGMAK